MPPPPQLEPPVLVLDAASPATTAGLRVAGGEFDWRSSSDEAGVGLFRLVDALLADASLHAGALRTIVFCEGPGSLLGVRIVAMAIRSWLALPAMQSLRVLAYRSFDLLAADLLESGRQPPFAVIGDARRSSWNRLDVSAAGELGAIRRWPAEAAFPAEIPVILAGGFPRWQKPPADAVEVAYRPALLPRLSAKYPLLRERSQPDAFLTETPTYRLWTQSSRDDPTKLPDHPRHS